MAAMPIPANMIKGIHHVGITVADIKSATDFYVEAAQLTPDMDAAQFTLPILPGTAGCAMLRGTNARLRLLALTNPPVPPEAETETETKTKTKILRPVSKAGITHFCLQAPEIKSLHHDFANAGATFHSHPVDLGTGFLYCYSRDLEANVVELEGVPRLWGDPRPWFAHVSISTSDIERLSNFYSTVLKHIAVRSPHLGPNARLDQVAGLSGVELKAAWIPADNIQIEVMQYFQPPTMPQDATNSDSFQNPQTGYSYICFEVAGAQEALTNLLGLGAVQTAELAALGNEHRIFCADPDGNLILLLALQQGEEEFSIVKLQDPFIVSRMTALRNKAQQPNKTQRKVS
jgi:catechol 2,3-dioxygenase-like lactoylglutathione lyase family enzyme